MHTFVDFLSGSRYEPVRGNLVYFDDKPIVENRSCGTTSWPVRMFKDCRSETDHVLPHVHNTIEVLCVTSGILELFIGNDVHYLPVGSLVLLNSLDIHAMGGSPCEYLVLMATPTLFSSYGANLQNYMPIDDAHKILLPDSAYARELRALILRAYALTQNDSIVSSLNAVALIMTMFARIMTYTTETRSNSIYLALDTQSSVQLEDIFEYVYAHSHENITLEQIAAYAHLSKSYFCRFFKRITGITFVEYLNAYRCAEAEKLMSDPSLTITEIAYRVGFSSLSYFNKTYRRIRKTTPTETRKQVLIRRAETA